jgi:hypothetical protein
MGLTQGMKVASGPLTRPAPAEENAGRGPPSPEGAHPQTHLTLRVGDGKDRTCRSVDANSMRPPLRTFNGWSTPSLLCPGVRSLVRSVNGWTGEPPTAS